MIKEELYSRLSRDIDGSTSDMIELQKILTAIPALAPESGGDGEEKKARALETVLRAWGFTDIERFDAPDERTSSGIRPNILVTVPGKRSDKRLWIITHIDVVPPGELSLWSTDPYEAVVSNGKVYGRGTEDNQQDLVASTIAARSLLRTGITPESTVFIAFVADEETGSTKGLGFLLDHEPSLFRKDDYIVVPDFGNDRGDGIEVAEKSVLWLRFHTTGKQCHASVPAMGSNAFRAASHLVVELERLQTLFSASDPLYDPPKSTFEPTKKEANVPNINTIPGDDTFYMDCRILPSYNLDDVMDEIHAITAQMGKLWNVTIKAEAVQKMQAPPPTPADSPVVQMLQEAVGHVYNVKAVPVGIGGGTVAALLRERDYPVAAWSKVNRMAHQPNEYCEIDVMTNNAKVFARLFLSEGGR